MKYLLRTFLLLLPLHKVLADPVVCSHHNNSLATCQSLVGCQPVTFDGGYLCTTNCTANDLQVSQTCNNYAGCKWDVNSDECRPFTENRYRAWDSATNEFIEADCPAEYPLSQPGTDAEEFCYKPCASSSDSADNTCGFYKDSFWGAGISCLKPNTNTLIFSNDYHLEGTNGCYLNDRPCNLFAAQDNEGNDINAHDGITGNANWNDSYYNTDNCRYETSVSDFANRSCNADVTYKPNTNTTSATENVIFNQLVSYYCTECTYDYFYPYSTTGPSFAGCINYNNFKVCSCKAIPQGHYRIIGWHAGISPENTYTACPAGKTTLTPYAGQYAGGVSIDDCKYGPETQLCDSAGCVNLSDPESWTDL